MDNSEVKVPLTKSQALMLIIPLMLAFLGSWLSIQLQLVEQKSKNMILEERITNNKNDLEKQNSYQIKSFAEIQKTLTEIQLTLRDKKDRDEKTQPSH